MKPCDCKSIDDTKRFLTEQGISFNNQSITVIPNYVLLKMDHTEIKIPMCRFKAFSEWYLTEQKDDNGNDDLEENKCHCPKGSICEFFDIDGEQCLYGIK